MSMILDSNYETCTNMYLTYINTYYVHTLVHTYLYKHIHFSSGRCTRSSWKALVDFW